MHVQGARCVVEALSEENSRLKSRNENLDHDLHSLLSIVKVARTTGNWEVSTYPVGVVHSTRVTEAAIAS